MKVLSKLLVVLLWPLLPLLSGCTLYSSVMHPYRLPTPRMTPEAKAKARAAEKARHRGTTLRAADPAEAADGSAATTDPATPATPTPATPATPEKPKALSYSELPAGTRAKYDKHLLLKDSKPRPRPLHRYKTGPLTARDASREVRRLRHYVKLPPREAVVPAPHGRPAPLNTYKTKALVAPRKTAPKTTRPAAPPVRAPLAAKPKTPLKAAPAVRARPKARVLPNNTRPAPTPLAAPKPGAVPAQPSQPAAPPRP